MKCETIEMRRLGRFVNGNWYEFITECRTKPRFYTIKRNNQVILHTSLYQTFNKQKRDILAQ